VLRKKEANMKKIDKVKAACYCCDGGDFLTIIKVIKETKEYKKEAMEEIKNRFLDINLL
jgi:hypothetical protein